MYAATRYFPARYFAPRYWPGDTTQGLYWTPDYFGGRYFTPSYWPGGGVTAGVHFAPRYFAARQFAPRYFPGRPTESDAWPIAGSGTVAWTDAAGTVITELLIDGAATLSWTATDDGETGSWQIAGVGTVTWFGGGGEDEAFRIDGVGTVAWTTPEGWTISGAAGLSWAPSVGVAEECLTADGTSAENVPVKNYVY